MADNLFERLPRSILFSAPKHSLMFLLVLFQFCHSESFHVKETVTAQMTIEPNEEIPIFIDSPYVTFLLPKHDIISADIYKKSGNSSYQFVGSLGPDIISFGIYFPFMGKVVLRTQKKAIAEFYAIVSDAKCSRIYISTHQNERFFGGIQNHQESIAILNNQDICFIHAANAYVRAELEFANEENIDFLYLNNGFHKKKFTGVGKYEAMGFNTTSVIWHSESSFSQKNFTIKFVSNSTLPQFKVNFTNTLMTPLFLTDYSNHNSKNIYDRAEANVIMSTKENADSNLLTALFLITILALCVILVILFSRKNGNVNQDETRILNDESDSSSELSFSEPQAE